MDALVGKMPWWDGCPGVMGVLMRWVPWQDGRAIPALPEPFQAPGAPF